ncbi:MAG: transporter, partial [Phenylobacterium sp.]|nr:transporter [Phenylobacterium sp.]
LTNGLVVDRMFRKRDDAHLRYYAFGAIVIALSGVLAPLAASPFIYLLITGPMKFLMNFAGVSIAALQVATPSRLRGRITALTGMVTQTVGATLGASLVAFFTDAVFHDRSKVIWSLALSTGLLIPTAGVLFWLGMKPMREAVARERLASAAA